MTEKTFKTANELNERINKLSFELSLWKQNIEIINITIKNCTKRKITDIHNDASLIDFKQIKEFVIKELSEKLEEAKHEFDNL